jgi:pimeloyl-ACP methyl ester carboxylesterase
MLTILLTGIGIVIAMSPGRLDAFRDRDGEIIEGSISERCFTRVNGVQQGMFIQSVDSSNPVLLFLHGGPGMTEFFMNSTHPTGLDRHFTMVWWEQRGAGMSFSGEIPPESMTSYLGIQVAAAVPDRFLAYVGMAQISYQLKSEVLAHAHMVGAYRARGDDAMARRLIAAPVSMTDGLSPAWMRLRDAAMHGLGVGHTHDMRSVITGIFLPVWRMKAYTVMEKINVWRGKIWSRPFFWDDLLGDDLSARLTEFDLPVYFFVGRYDYTANKDLSRAYFDKINAPAKGFYLFENAAHSPLFEEPVRATEILLQDVLQGLNALADGR